MVNAVVVGDHPMKIKFLFSRAGLQIMTPIVRTPTPKDVFGKTVYGHIDHNLQRLPVEIWDIDYFGEEPSDPQSIEEMMEAGAHLRKVK